MKRLTLRASNPYLRNAALLELSLIKSVESSTAVEGVRVKLSAKPSKKSSTPRTASRSSR
jgi:hypothetical protein